MEFPTDNNWTCPFPILGLLGGIFKFIQNLTETLTVENLIRRRVLRRLIWFCTVCRCPTKRTLGLYGLKAETINQMFVLLPSTFSFEKLQIIC